MNASRFNRTMKTFAKKRAFRRPTYIAKGTIRAAIIENNEPKYIRDYAGIAVTTTTNNSIPTFSPTSGSGMI